jgi:hypothetical protein
MNLIVESQNKSPAVNSIDGIVKEVLQIISGDKGKHRDWNAFRNLFLPTARFTVLNHNDTLTKGVETVGLDEFITMMHDEYYDNGFFEKELSKSVEEYNGIASVFQSFYAKDSENKEEKGINAYQLAYFNKRWWIVSILWTGNDNKIEIPSKYLGKNTQ